MVILSIEQFIMFYVPHHLHFIILKLKRYRNQLNFDKVFFKSINVTKVFQHCKFYSLKQNQLELTLLIYYRLAERLWRPPGDDLAVSQLSTSLALNIIKKGLLCFNAKWYVHLSFSMSINRDLFFSNRREWHSSIHVTFYRWFTFS